MTASTQLRALEGEIESAATNPLFDAGERCIAFAKIIQKFQSIAKELEADLCERTQQLEAARADNEPLRRHWEDAVAERDAIKTASAEWESELSIARESNARLKRQLDEAMKELLMVKVGFEITGPSKAVEYIDHRITEIDKL